MTEGFRVQGSGFRVQGSGGRVRLSPGLVAARCLLLAACCLLLAGCGSPKLEKTSVSGRITYGGGDWPKAGKVNFVPTKVAPGYTRHPGTGDFGTDGRFTVESSAGSPGLVPGEYRVRVECWETYPSMDKPNSGKSYVPQECQQGKAEGMTLVIEPGQSKAEFNFDVPKP